MKVFQHEPLDLSRNQIRLIKVLPRASSDPVQCTVSVFNEDRPSYRALSYTWGRAQPTHTILLNGSRFEIRSNLHFFLSNVVHTEALEVDYIFIDQLCIDQNATRERDQQVQRMAETYNKASQVIAWLGAGKASDLQRWQTMAPLDTWISDQESEGCRWLREMGRQTYWQRLWIVQELMLAEQFYLVYNSRILTFRQLFEDVFTSMKGRACLRDPESKAYDLLWDIWTLRFDPRKGPVPRRVLQGMRSRHLFELTCAYSRLACQDPRDKIYGLQGMLRAELRLPVDYSKASGDVYWEAMASLSSSTGRSSGAFDYYALGDTMGVSGQEHSITQAALARFAEIFYGKTPAQVFSPSTDQERQWVKWKKATYWLPDEDGRQEGPDRDKWPLA